MARKRLRMVVDDEPAPDPDVLEIRIHGVANTPPAGMLGLDVTQIVRVDGDDLGNFWSLTPQAVADVAALPPTDHRTIPDGVRREAYSWGAMARLATVPGLGAVSGILAGIVRALWVLIIPFGFANVAYWSRDLEEPRRTRWGSGSGALVRLFGLTLTLLWVGTAATVTLWIIAAQCYGPAEDDPVAYVEVCTALPSFIDSWARWDAGPRTAVLAALSAVAVLLLGAVGSTGRLKYERRISRAKATGMTDPAAGNSSWPVLARPGFWSHAQRSGLLWLGHLTASFSLLTLVLAWHYLYRGHPACWFGNGFGQGGCLTPDVWNTGDGAGWAALVAVSTVLLLLAAYCVARVRIDPASLDEQAAAAAAAARSAAGDAPAGAPAPRKSRKGLDRVILLASFAAFVVCEALVARTGDLAVSPPPDASVPDPGTVPFVGLEALPAVLVAILLLFCITAIGLRARISAVFWIGCVVVAGVTGVGAMWWPDASSAMALRVVAGGAVLLLLVVAVARNLSQKGRKRLGWGGRAPFVFLTIAAGTAMVLSAATVAGVTAWLERPGAPENVPLTEAGATAMEDVDAADGLHRPVQTDLTNQVHLTSPQGYDEFAIVSVVAVAALVLLVLALCVRAWFLRSTRVPDLPVVPSAKARPTASVVTADPGTPGDEEVQATRHAAALAHRAERIVGALAGIFFLALIGTLVLRALGEDPGRLDGALWDLLVRWSGPAVAIAAGMLIASVVVAGSKKSLTRPWGLLWDLMCFLPRAAHPFAPPCYAERAVPELRSRVDAWLGDDLTDPVEKAKLARRRVVLSAHSLGAVVAVGAIFARWDAKDGPGPNDPRIALLTYGTQLRAFFGRFFPELLGPGVLGTNAAPGARLWAEDPWSSEVTTPEAPKLTLVSALTVPVVGKHPPVLRWRSLWRRTDYIGFPVDDYATTPRGIDHRASEIDQTTYLFAVSTHSDYPRAPEYREQLDVLLTEVRKP